MNDGTPAVEICGLCLQYEGGERFLFRDFSVRVEEGETLAVMGESGCGKSTLLLCLCGVVPRSIRAEMSGEVRLWGRPVAEYGRGELSAMVGAVFQNPDTQLFCDSVEDELAFGLENLCLGKEEMEERICEALELSGLEQYRYTSPGLLSGGQKQLVVLSAVLAMRPRLLLLDEAMSQLDGEAKEKMAAVFKKLQEKRQTMVMVDHDIESIDIAHKIVRIGD